MKSVALLLVAWFLAGPSATRPAFADERAVQRAMENQRKAVEAEMRRQAEYEKKMMENQRRAMQEQAKAEHKYMEMQQKAMHEQQKMLQNQQKAMQHQQAASQHQATAQHQANPPHVTTTATATPVYHAARPYYGHHSTRHAYHRTTYRHYRTMPTQVDPETLALQRLKKSLDSVPMGSTVTSNHKTAIKKALMGVVEVPKVPTVASIETLSGHLAEGLANRTASGAQTGPMALSLRAAMNSTMLANNELVEVMNEHRAALRNSKFRPTEVTAVMESLKTISNQERAHR